MKYERNLTSIISLIKNGEKNIKDFKIGVKFEHIVVNKNTMESVAYYGKECIEHILQGLLSKGYEGNYEENHLIGLLTEGKKIILNPGGQIEVKIKPCKTVKEIESIYFNFLDDIVPILEKYNLLLMSIGYHPKTSVKDIPFVPGKKYEYMLDSLKGEGRNIYNMVKGTAALRVSIDYKDEHDFIEKFRVANFISPLLCLISDNSPMFEGKVYDKFCLRGLIWANVNEERNGVVPDSFGRDFGYKDYAEYILSTPPILIMKNGNLIITGNKTVEELMDKYVFTEKEMGYIMTMALPSVRVKNHIEICVGDALPHPYNLAYIALIKGIFYNDIALEYLYNFSQRREQKQVGKVRKYMYQKGFDAYFGSKTAYEYILILFDLAKKFLEEEEREMLIPLEKLVVNKDTPSTILKKKFNEEGIDGLKWCSLNRWII